MSDSNFADDIVQDEVPTHLLATGTPKTKFQPWHRVRKHFIRERQWNHEIGHLAKRLRRELTDATTEEVDENASLPPIPPERPLRCLVLPGDEILDMRSLWKHLTPEGCSLRFLGFNEIVSSFERRREMDIAEFSITQLPRVCKRSRVLGDRFQDIGKNNTRAYQLFLEYGPYDVVNLDLCQSLVPRGVQGEMDANYTAIHQLLIHQIQKQKTPWLLFATTQVDKESASQAEISKLASPIRNNCDEHVEFSNELEKLIPSPSFKSTEHSLDISHLNADQLVKIFGVILGKWILQKLYESSPKCGIKLLTSYRYVIRDALPNQGLEAVEMLSLGFFITPHFSLPIDKTGISSITPQTKVFPTELESALAFLNVASRIANVDEILQADKLLRSGLAERTAELLAAVNYNAAEYLVWVEKGEPDSAF